MFLKTHRRQKNGKVHCYHSIAENRRTTRGIVQRQVLYPREINDSQREAWEKAIRVFDEDQQSERDVAVYTSASALPSHAEGHGVRVCLDAMETAPPAPMGRLLAGRRTLATTRSRLFPAAAPRHQSRRHRLDQSPPCPDHLPAA